ncbi:MAG: aminotransferase class I/II-fold pyridoxal phosphate-dependent enzyme [Alphaproteobacteria bacterium]|nr:aminotransferase class I/II-fold pyridoxal phosphate-dependent enzyme [Alphaproteobacteria bacterium]
MTTRRGPATRGGISPFIVMEVMRAANARAAAGGGVAHLEVGQPGTPAPAGVLAAARAALDRDRLGYTEALGLPRLRERIARHYGEQHGLKVAPDRIVVTTGSSGAFLLAFLAAFDAGDAVAMAAPGYPAYRNILTALGNRPVALRTGVHERFQPTPELLASAGPLAGLIVASPSNPTGTMLGRAELAALAEACDRQGAWLVSDEIYHGITYGRAAVSALAVTDQAIVVNSFSKYYSMTGWRIGWLVLPPELVQPVERLAQNLFISPPTLAQIAAEAAFDCRAELDANVAAYARNRALLLDALPRAGFDRLAPSDGAFYLYADIGALTNDSAEFCRRMLAEAGVAATPGIDFDPQEGHRWLRFSFAGSEAEVRDAIARLAAWRS